jgi:hypothetical protein
MFQTIRLNCLIGSLLAVAAPGEVAFIVTAKALPGTPKVITFNDFSGVLFPITPSAPRQVGGTAGVNAVAGSDSTETFVGQRRSANPGRPAIVAGSEAC